MKARFAVAGVLLFAAAASAQQQTTISTLSNVGHPRVSSGLIWSWGGLISGTSFTEVYGIGQTFTAPTGTTRLNQFGFWTAGGENCAPSPPTICDMQFLALLATWNPSLGVMGSVLWSQMMTLGPLDPYNQILNNHILATPMIDISPGTYAAVLLPVAPGALIPTNYAGDFYTDVSFLANITAIDDEQFPFEDLVYPGGAMLSYRGPAQFDPNSWSADRGYDFTFDAQFTTTPEPATIILLGIGLAGLGAAARRRKRTASQGSESAPTPNT